MREKRNTVGRTGALAALIVGWIGFGSTQAQAQGFCSDLQALLRAAPSEFVSETGAPVDGAWPEELAVFEGTQPLAGASGCVVAQQTSNGRHFSTSYTCSNVAADDDAGISDLRQRMASCVSVTAWIEQQGNGALSAQYGLLRLSITRNGPRGGLALGVEAFRDENGGVLGSPTRGDAVGDDGSHRCSSTTPQAIADFLAMYGQRPGAEPFEDERFIGFTNRITQPVAAFMTKPTHPAHPAIIVRSVTERDGVAYVSARGDFAGDCEAFLTLLAQVDEMNRNLRRDR
jgi:hypothetical protein